MKEKRRYKTYIKGFDEAIEGGIPEGFVVLFSGTPGTLKSTISYNILYNNALFENVAGLYISLEQSGTSLSTQMLGFNMDIDAVSDRLKIVDFGNAMKKLELLSQKDVFLTIFKDKIENLKNELHFELIVIDSLPVLEILGKFKNPRVQTFALFEWLRDLGLTTILISEISPTSTIKDSHIFDKEFLSDGIIHTKMERLTETDVRRLIRCVKLRGTKHSTDYFEISFDEGFKVTELI